MVPQCVAQLGSGEFFGERCFEQDVRTRNASISVGNKPLTCLSLTVRDCEELALRKKIGMNQQNKRVKNRVVGKKGTKFSVATRGSKLLSDPHHAHLRTRPESEKDRLLIRQSVGKNHAITEMLQLTEAHLEALVSEMMWLDVKAGTDLITEGEVGTTFYVVHDGLFEVKVGGSAS